MTSAAASTKDRTVPGGAPADHTRALLALAKSPANVIRFALIGVAFAFMFKEWLWTQHIHSWGHHDWSHSYFVPIISLYILWQNRAEIVRTPVWVYWPGLAPVVLGLVSYMFFVVGVPNHMGQGWSLVLTLMGLALLNLGPRMMEWLFFPIAYLVMAVTVSEKIMINITFKLQQWAAEGGYVLLRIFGISADLKGNTIEIFPAAGEKIPLNVAEACSGMSMVIAFIALGAAMALVACKQWWQRVVLVMLAVPIALLLNVLRIAVLGILSLYDRDLSTGQAHTLIGTLLLVPGFFVYCGVVWALNRSVREGVPSKTASSKAASSKASSVKAAKPAGNTESTKPEASRPAPDAWRKGDA